MNRVGDRALPFGLQWVGGSDWVILHRDFVHYLVTSDDGLVRALTSFYFYSLKIEVPRLGRVSFRHFDRLDSV